METYRYHEAVLLALTDLLEIANSENSEFEPAYYLERMLMLERLADSGRVMGQYGDRDRFNRNYQLEDSLRHQIVDFGSTIEPSKLIEVLDKVQQGSVVAMALRNAATNQS